MVQADLISFFGMSPECIRDQEKSGGIVYVDIGHNLCRLSEC
jgi:ethanolamine utilization protein EutA (predicted chaperonin)